MQLIPVFKIGILNAWIFILLILLPLLLVGLFYRKVFKKTDSIHTSILTSREKKIFILSKVILFLVFIYSVFLPLKLGTVWFYTGLPIYLLGLILYTIVWVNVVTSPPDKPITKGLYRFSRHPMYVTFILIFIGTGIATASWLFLVLSIMLIITHFYNGTIEERECLEAYGKAYQEYVSKTPKWFGIPKL